MKCLVIVFALTAPCYAQHITVSDQLPMPVRYPAEVYKMSDADFAKWASDFNSKQVADVEVRRSKITEEKWIQGEVTASNEAHVEFGGYGWNGWNGWNGGWNSCNGFGNCGFAALGNSSQDSTTYPVRWKNPAYYGPGPLTIINPYCRPTQ